MLQKSKGMMLSLLLCLGALAGFYLKAHAQAAGAAIDAAFVRLYNSVGQTGWKMSVDSSGILNITSQANAGVTGALHPLGTTFDPVTGAQRVPGYMATTLATLQSPASGYFLLCLNCGTTSNLKGSTMSPVVSTWSTGGTGSGLGAWTLY